ncbi:MAG: glycoside hydrolase family 127 protein [Opitutaceae bacterium]|jgi:hypothetical protein|nr:glycoside hydrolase family 127 protein [Opitutaceae bacterium]
MAKSPSRLFWIVLALACAPFESAVARAGSLTIVERPPAGATNAHYTGNRAPLLPSRFIALPPGAVRAKGWLLEMLHRQRDGLCGRLGEISAWLQKEDNAWLGGDGLGKYGWEEVPYWLKGYQLMGCVLDDKKILTGSGIWIEGALNSQREDGDFGPDQRFKDDGTRDYWANMIMLFCLQNHYEHTGDKRVLELMTRYFYHQLAVPDKKFLTHYWQRMRGGDNLYSVYWLYNRTGDGKLLELAEKIHRRTASWAIPGTLPNWHNVNIAQCFREPATHYLQTHDERELRATYANFHEIRKRFGQAPGGMFGGDENSRPGYTDPHQATETCGFVEQMLSDQLLMQITGDPFWADHCEDVAFNSMPASMMPDMRALRYFTAPNMVVSDAQNHAPGIQNRGPFFMMNPFSSRCCQHNHSTGWPYYAKHLWLATPDNGLCAALYSASEATARVGAKGGTVRVIEETLYPFGERILFTIRKEGADAAAFPLYLRVPAWCGSATVSINGKNVPAAATPGSYIRIERDWRDNDTVTLDLPMRVAVREWTQNHNSVSVNYGPLTFSLKIGERYERRDSVETAIRDSRWQPGVDKSKWPSFEIFPTTPWNYGLLLDDGAGVQREKSFDVQKLAWPENNFPFTPDSVPIRMTVRAKKIPQWTLDGHGLAGKLQPGPVVSREPEETVTLIPMGAARLRISAFPVIAVGDAAHAWTPSMEHK